MEWCRSRNVLLRGPLSRAARHAVESMCWFNDGSDRDDEVRYARNIASRNTRGAGMDDYSMENNNEKNAPRAFYLNSVCDKVKSHFFVAPLTVIIVSNTSFYLLVALRVNSVFV